MSKEIREEAVNQNIDLLQIVEITLGEGSYGVNILKVREILTQQKITKLPDTNPTIKGVFNYRGEVVPVINLHHSLSVEENSVDKNTLVLNFNDKLVAFEVDTIEGTSTHEWDTVISPEGVLEEGSANSYTGIINDDGRMIIMIDFEYLVSETNKSMEELSEEIEIEGGLNQKEVEEYKQVNIVFAEDSKMMTEVISTNLKANGFQNILSFKDGKEVMKYIDSTKNDIDIFILDVEMPFINGFTITKHIKEESRFKNKPVVLFSSLINEDMKNRGNLVGADKQVSKPNTQELMEIIKELTT